MAQADEEALWAARLSRGRAEPAPPRQRVQSSAFPLLLAGGFGLGSDGSVSQERVREPELVLELLCVGIGEIL